MYGREPRGVAKSLHRLQEHLEGEISLALPEESVEKFRALLRQFDLVIVGEGHYEPAFSSAQAV